MVDKSIPAEILHLQDPQNILPALKWSKTIIQNLKNCIFWNLIKIGLNALKYQIGVRNDSKTPQGPISGRISSFRPISATLSKFEFLAKINFLANIGTFDFSKSRRAWQNRTQGVFFIVFQRNRGLLISTVRLKKKWHSLRFGYFHKL